MSSTLALRRAMISLCAPAACSAGTPGSPSRGETFGSRCSGARRAPNWRPEEVFLRREPGELFVGRNPRIRGGNSHLVDHWPIDAVLGTEHVSRAVPWRSGHLGY